MEILEYIYIVEDNDFEVIDDPAKNDQSKNLGQGVSAKIGGQLFGQLEKLEQRPAKQDHDVADDLVDLPVPLLAVAMLSSPLLWSSGFAKKANKKSLSKILIRNSINLKLASERGFKFPPGHPRVGESYKLHPLAHISNLNKNLVYIPQDKFDEILLEERESELIRLLVELGATKISISETSNRGFSKKRNVAGEGVVGTALEASGEYEKITGSRDLDSDTREFELVGKPWSESTKLDRSRFGWVAFEPSWEALVMAREVGQCTKAMIEIREENFFASEKRVSAELKARIAKVKGSEDNQRERTRGRSYIVRAEFSSFVGAV